MKNINYVFLGTPDIAVACVDALTQAGMPPALVITAPDRPSGRGQIITPSPVKVWALAHGIPVLQPEHLDSVIETLRSGESYEVFVLAAYGQILSKEFLSIPKKGVVNMHPSLLPKLRGPSPIRTALLNNTPQYVGISIMLIDHKMDHGPIIFQQPVHIDTWPIPGRALDAHLAQIGGKILVDTLPKYIEGTITPKEQNHEEATYCKMIQKNDAEINLKDAAEKNLAKIFAYDEWPSAYTYIMKGGKNVRIKIISAHCEQGVLVLDKVIPEGKKEMLFTDFTRV